MTKRSVLTMLAVLVGVWSGRWLSSQRQQLRTLQRDFVELQDLRARLGSIAALPPSLAEEISRRQGWSATARSATPLVILAVDAEDCLVCLAEISRWKRVALHNSRVRMAAILLGGTQQVATADSTSEQLPFPFVADSARLLLRELGLARVPGRSLRLVSIEGRLGMIAVGIDNGPSGFIESVDALSAHRSLPPAEQSTIEP